MNYDPIHDTYVPSPTPKREPISNPTYQATPNSAITNQATSDSATTNQTMPNITNQTVPNITNQAMPNITNQTMPNITNQATPYNAMSNHAPSNIPIINQATPYNGMPNQATPYNSMSNQATPFNAVSNQATPFNAMSNQATPYNAVSSQGTPDSINAITNHASNDIYRADIVKQEPHSMPISNGSGGPASPSRKAISIESLVSPAIDRNNRSILNDQDFEPDSFYTQHNTETKLENPQSPVPAYPHEQHTQPATIFPDDNSDNKKKASLSSSSSAGESRSPTGKKPTVGATHAHGKPVRHLKKADGAAFWRKDIQHDFLLELFDNDQAVFTNYFPHCNIPATNNGPKYTFAELYIRTLAESSKSSRILKERLIKDKEMAKSVAKVCLLVNAGRMNTTINFVPEMRSSLRTYHSIPSLQADPDTGGSKQLQDTPRLKSILKAVCEGQEHLKTVGDIINHPTEKKPNVNVIQLIFLLSNHYHNIRYHYEDDHEDPKNNVNKFMEFFLSPEIHPKNRAKRFLWLMYTYLETSFKPEELAANPFNPYVIPPLEIVPESEVENFDIDTEYEKKFSEQMYQTRLRYLVDEEHNSNPKRGNKSKKDREFMQQQLVKHRLNEFDEEDDDDDEDGSEAVANESTADMPGQKVAKIEKKPASDETPTKKRSSSSTSNSSKPKRKMRKLASKPSNEKDTPKTNTVNGKVSGKGGKPGPKPASNSKPQVKEAKPEAEAGKRLDDRPSYYPAASLEELQQLINTYVSSIPVVPLSKGAKTSISNRTAVVNKSKAIIRQVRNSNRAGTAMFNRRLALLNDWLYKFFQYKKSTHNGLVGMEWEEIRHDLTTGLETYIYQQLGKSFTAFRSRQQEESGESGGEKTGTDTNGPPSSNMIGSIAVGNVIGSIHGSVGTIDYNNIDIEHPAYLAIHDFDHANEKSTFVADLLTFCANWLLDINSKAIEENESSGDLKLDLVNGKVNFV